jgi:hypothetical protein
MNSEKDIIECETHSYINKQSVTDFRSGSVKKICQICGHKDQSIPSGISPASTETYEQIEEKFYNKG